MLDWDKLRVFYAVAKAKNITKAGEELGLNQSSVSRQITALEERMQAPLFHRRPRGLVLTEQGEILQKTVAEFFQKLATTENALLEINEKPKGELKVTAPVAFSTVWLVPRVKEFMERYTEIQLTLIVDDRKLDLSEREADIAIRFYPATNPDLVQRSLFKVHSSLYASNDYLQRHGTPRRLEDLKHHHLITYTEGPHQPYGEVNWHFHEAARRGVELKPTFSINNLYGALRAVKSGMGIAFLPDYMIERAKRVSRILPELKGPLAEAFFVYPMDMKASPRIRAFLHFLEQKVAEYHF